MHSDLFDLCQLFAAASHIVIANLVQRLLLILTLDGISLTVDDSGWGHYAVRRRVRLHHLGGWGTWRNAQ